MMGTLCWCSMPVTVYLRWSITGIDFPTKISSSGFIDLGRGTLEERGTLEIEVP